MQDPPALVQGPKFRSNFDQNSIVPNWIVLRSMFDQNSIEFRSRFDQFDRNSIKFRSKSDRYWSNSDGIQSKSKIVLISIEIRSKFDQVLIEICWILFKMWLAQFARPNPCFCWQARYFVHVRGSSWVCEFRSKFNQNLIAVRSMLRSSLGVDFRSNLVLNLIRFRSHFDPNLFKIVRIWMGAHFDLTPC